MDTQERECVQGSSQLGSVDNGVEVYGSSHSHTSSSSINLLDEHPAGVVPSFQDPWHDATSSSNEHNHQYGHSTPRRSSSHKIPSIPGTPKARTSTSSSSHFRILRSFSSRFVEDLPEFQPYSDITSTSQAVHRRRFKSSPTVSLSALRRRSNATHVTTFSSHPSREPASRSSNASGEDNPHQKSTTDKNSANKRNVNQKWKPMLLASACLSIAAIASNSKAGQSSSSSTSRTNQHHYHYDQPEPEMIQTNSRFFHRETHSLTPQRNEFYDPSSTTTIITRRPSKLKKRPPSTIPSSTLQSRRGSTYTEWRKSMVIEISADVSRRSSQRSKKSTTSRGGTSTSARTFTSAFSANGAGGGSGRRRLIGKESRGIRRRDNGILRRLSRRLIGLLRCQSR